MSIPPSQHVTMGVHVCCHIRTYRRKDCCLYWSLSIPDTNVTVLMYCSETECPFISGVKLYTRTVLGERKDPHFRDVLRASHAVRMHIH